MTPPAMAPALVLCAVPLSELLVEVGVAETVTVTLEPEGELEGEPPPVTDAPEEGDEDGGGAVPDTTSSLSLAVPREQKKRRISVICIDKITIKDISSYRNLQSFWQRWDQTY
jgi:hypothetical protein